MKPRPHSRFGIEVKEDESGNAYIFLKSPDGGYHAFVEVAAKTAMRECGADTENKNTRQAGEEFLDI